MTRVTIKLIDGSRISVVTDEIASVTTSRARLGPARITIHTQGEEEPSSWQAPDLMCAAMRAVTGLERVDADPLPRHPCDAPMPEDRPEDMTRAGEHRPFAIEPRDIKIPRVTYTRR